MNAENMEFDDEIFDIIISWGVIHHSGNMQKIIDEIYRVLKPDGKAYIMVYNKNSLRYNIFCFFWHGIIRLNFMKQNLNEIAGSITEGYIARHLTENDFNTMAKKFSLIKYSYSDEINTVSGYLFGLFNRILKFIPNFQKKIEKK